GRGRQGRGDRSTHGRSGRVAGAAWRGARLEHRQRPRRRVGDSVRGSRRLGPEGNPWRMAAVRRRGLDEPLSVGLGPAGRWGRVWEREFPKIRSGMRGTILTLALSGGGLLL